MNEGNDAKQTLPASAGNEQSNTLEPGGSTPALNVASLSREGSGLLSVLDGRKTYSLAVVAGVLLFGSWQHWWVIPADVYRALELLMLVCIRHGVNRIKTP
jgi:hypothetical protein